MCSKSQKINQVNFLYNTNNLFIITVYVPCGSIYENYDSNKNKKIAGLSHFLEHLLFKHTENFTGSEILHEFTRIGGYYNASTDKDETMYYVKTLSENYKTAVDLLYDIVVKPVFLQDDINTERKIVLEELAQSKDDFSDTLYEESTTTLLSSNNIYTPSVIGKKTHLQTLNIKDIIKYYKQHYKDVMVVINCDKTFKTEIKRYVSSKFGDNKMISFYEPKLQLLADRFQNETNKRIRIEVNETYQYNTSILFPSFKFCNSYKNTLLNFVKFCLTDAGLYSILSYEIREKRGLVYSIKMSNERMRYLGILRVTFGTSNKDICGILKVILDIINNMKKHGLTYEQLEYFKDSYKNSIMYRFTNEEYRASWYGDNWFYGSKQTQDELIKAIDKINNNDVKRICKEVFCLDKIGFYTNGNYDNPQELYVSIKDIIETYSRKKY
jgi:predicted Zn-dependent peptidase